MKIQKNIPPPIKLFENKQVVSWSELLSYYASSSIHNLVKKGLLVKISAGRYTLPGYKESSEYFSWALVAQKSSRGVICLISALKYHGITLQNPHQLWWAIPQGYHAPRLKYPSLRVVRLSKQSISEGVDTVSVDGLTMKVFNIAKTVTDCFKFRNKIGLHVAIEALTDSWEQKRLDLNSMWKYAEINRVQRIIQPYMDTLK